MEVSRAALGNGLLLTVDTARKLVDSIPAEECVFEDLRGRGFPDLQRDLRRLMRPPETAATMPMAEILPPPATEGPAALPGAGHARG